MSILLMIASFGFLLSICYGVLSPYRDSGDLVAAAFSLGIAHPPGYALYSLMSRIGMELFPFGNFAYRANFLSALWTALTGAIVFALLQKKVVWQSALLAIALWLFSPAVVQLSLVSEMYSLNALFCSILFLCYGKFSQENSLRTLFLCFFLVGLALLNHPTILFLVPALFWTWINSRKLQGGREGFIPQFGYCILFGLLGFSLLFFYPIRSFCEPLVDWGEPETVQRIWRLITRSDYGGLKLHPEESVLVWSFSDILTQLSLFLKAEWRELKGWGIVLAFLGFLRSIRSREPVSFWLISFFISGPLFFILSNLPPNVETTLPILEPYLVMANLLLLPWLAKGIEPVFLHSRLRTGPWSFFIFAFLLIFLLFHSFPPSRRRDFFAYDYGKNILKTMPLGSSLYDPDDTTAFVLTYLQVVENQRRDISLLMTLRTRWGYEQLKKRKAELLPKGEFRSAQEFIPALLSFHLQTARPLFSDHPSKFLPGMEQFPVGILSLAGRVPEGKKFLALQEVFHFYVDARGSHPPVADAAPEFFTRHLLSRISASFNNIAIQLQNQKQFSEAERYFQAALLRQPELSEAWNNLGLNFYFRGEYGSAEKLFKRGIQKARKKDTLYYHLALAQKKMGKKEDAKSSLQQAIQLNPQKIDALNDLGLIYLEEKEWNRAQELFHECVRLNKNYAPAHYNLGLLYRGWGKKKEAAESFENYLRVSPNAEDVKEVQNWISSLRSSL